MPIELVMIPGNMCDGRVWAPLRAHLALRGIEAASSPVPMDDTISGMAATVLEAGGEHIIPIGFSMGAIVALEMARLAPERVKALALLSLNAGADLPERAGARPLQQERVKAGGLEALVQDSLLPLYFGRIGSAEPELSRLVVDMALAIGPDIFVSQSEALRTRADLMSVLRSFAPPVFLGCGEQDILCSPDWHRQYRQVARNAELHIVADAGHMLPIEAPAAVAAPLAAWLESRVLGASR